MSRITIDADHAASVKGRTTDKTTEIPKEGVLEEGERGRFFT